MDVATLQNILLHTFSTDGATRNAAEEAVSHLGMHPNSVLLLLEIAVDAKCERGIRQASSIVLKNLLQKHWDNSHEETFTFPVEARDQYRPCILQAFFQLEDSSLRNILSECFNTVARVDFPVGSWSGLPPQLIHYIHRQIGPR
jgi:hypothetical protein